MFNGDKAGFQDLPVGNWKLKKKKKKKQRVSHDTAHLLKNQSQTLWNGLLDHAEEMLLRMTYQLS